MPEREELHTPAASFGPALMRLMERADLVGTDPARLIELVVPEVDRLLGPHREILAVVDEEPPQLIVASHHGSSPPLGDHLVASGREALLPHLMEGSSLFFPGTATASGVTLRMGVGPQEGVLLLPLKGAGELVGAWLIGMDGTRLPDPPVQAFLQLIARYLGPLVGWSCLRASIRRRYGHLPQTERLAEMGRLVAGVAHELGSPLQSIISMAELLERDPARTDPLEAAHRILRSAMRCHGIVQDLLTFARKDPDRLQLVNVQDVLLDAIELDRFSDIGEVQVRIEGQDELPKVLADAQRLSQVFLNLITNARHAVRKDGKPGLVSIQVRRLSSGASRLEVPGDVDVVQVTVEDQGPGVPPELRSRIFEPFFTTKELGVGTGLGLSISRTLVSGMGGALYLDDGEDVGARFVVELPAAPSRTLAGPAPDASERDDERRDERPCSILLVDDDRDVLDTYDMVLSLDDHRVKGCDRAHKALEALSDDPYDVILCDVRLPDMSGPAFLEALDRNYPEMAPRVIFATGDVMSDDTRAFLASVPNPNLIKPFRLEDLHRAIRQVRSPESRADS